MSGVVEVVGDHVAGFHKGDRVLGNVDGAFAEYAVVEAGSLVSIPDNLTFEAAASIIGSADAAWKALFLEGELKSGQTVLIHAAAGGVRQYAVQLAKWKGAEVIGTASADNLDYVRGLGADQVIDYTQTPFEKSVKGVDLVVDLVGGDTENRSWSFLKRGGILVSLVQPPSADHVERYHVAAKFNTKFPTRDDVERIVRLIADGTLRPGIDSIYTLAEVKEAFARSEARHSRGRILLHIS